MINENDPAYPLKNARMIAESKRKQALERINEADRCLAQARVYEEQAEKWERAAQILEAGYAQKGEGK